MKVEAEIRGILRLPSGHEKKADKICKFMNWDRKELIEVMQKYTTFTIQNRSKIIRHFWGVGKSY